MDNGTEAQSNAPKNLFNKSMNDFIQKANEAALLAAQSNNKNLEPKLNNISFSSEAKGYNPPVEVNRFLCRMFSDKSNYKKKKKLLLF